LSGTLQANELIHIYIDGESVVEFGDVGKAANQYPTAVGNLNVISSTIVTSSPNGTLIDDSFSSRQEKQSPPSLSNSDTTNQE